MKALFLLCLVSVVAQIASAESEAVTTTFFNKHLAWKKVGGSDYKEYDYIAELEFCGDDATGVFGFRIPDTDTACGAAAPLIRMKPGKTYRLILINNSDNPVNMHTHGLHIGGNGDSDNISRSANAGTCLVYNYEIAADHMGGTHWYHVHNHGNVERLVHGGAFGMLIIEEEENLLETYPESIKKWLNNEVILQLSSIPIDRVRVNLANAGDLDTVVIVKDEWYRFRISSVTLDSKINYIEFRGPCETLVAAYVRKMLRLRSEFVSLSLEISLTLRHVLHSTTGRCLAHDRSTS